MGSPLVLLFLNFSKHVRNGERAFPSLFSAVFKPTSDINDLYSIYDEVAGIIIIITRDESFAYQW